MIGRQACNVVTLPLAAEWEACHSQVAEPLSLLRQQLPSVELGTRKAHFQYEPAQPTNPCPAVAAVCRGRTPVGGRDAAEPGAGGCAGGCRQRAPRALATCGVPA